MDKYFEYEQNGLPLLKEVDAARFDEIKHSGRGVVTVGIGAVTHHIAGSRHLNSQIGFNQENHGLVIYGNGGALRVYPVPSWYEGDQFQFDAPIY